MDEKKITVTGVINATIHIDNRDDAQCEYSISADAVINDGGVTSLTRGEVLPRTDSPAPWSATFKGTDADNLTVSFCMAGRDVRPAVLEAVASFVEAARTEIDYTRILSKA